MNRKWIAYSVTSIVGIGIVAGGATTAAASMELRTTAGDVLPGGVITGKDGTLLDRPTVQLQVTGSSATVVSAVTPAALTSTISPTSAPTPASPASAASAGSAPSPASAPGAGSAPSPASAPSAVSASSPGSVASANSA